MARKGASGTEWMQAEANWNGASFLSLVVGGIVCCWRGAGGYARCG